MAKKTEEVLQDAAAEELTPEPDDVAAELSRLGAELQAVAGNKLAREAKLKEVERVLSKLRIEDFEELSESPTIQKFVAMLAKTDDMRPGEVKNKGTLAEVQRDWTWRDIQDMVRSGQMPLVRLTPGETITLTFQGLALRVNANEECEIPRCFYDIYRDHVKAINQAAINERWLMGVSDVPPDPNWMTPMSAIVRAHSMQGQERGLKSGFLTTGVIREDNTPAGGGNA